jgi:subtilase family serine protease
VPRTTSFAWTALAVVCIAFIQLSAAPSRTALPGSVPSWAKAANRSGAANADDTVVFRVYLPWRGGDAAAAFAVSVSTPGHANAGQFLTPTQFRNQFSPTSQDMSAVTSWLKQQGFAIGYTPENRHFVEASGTVAQAASAFSTTFSIYSYAGAQLLSPDKTLTVPSSLPAVAAVVGLDEGNALVRPASANAPPPDAFVNARPCSAYWGEKTVANTPTPDGTVLPAAPSAFAPCGYAGAQLQGVYGLAGAIAGGTDGRGVTVAVIDARVADDRPGHRGLLVAARPAKYARTLPPGRRARHVPASAEQGAGSAGMVR